MNAILGEKIAITADKPQTTRNRIRGIYNEFGEDGALLYQVVFLDTPGITRPRNKLGSFMADTALSAFSDVDVIVFITDDPGEIRGGDSFILDKLTETDTPCILVINKTDLMGPDEFKRAYEEWEKCGRFMAITGTCAVAGEGIPELMAEVKKFIGDGPQYFPENIVTDLPERFLVTEIIREKLLHYLRDEVPHGIAVEVESWKDEAKMTRISAVIFTEKKSHKGIIIGKAGHTLKGVGKASRLEMESLLGIRVHLDLWVKVKENWREDEMMLGSLGYRE